VARRVSFQIVFDSEKFTPRPVYPYFDSVWKRDTGKISIQQREILLEHFHLQKIADGVIYYDS
jgi:hypothetical protein